MTLSAETVNEKKKGFGDDPATNKLKIICNRPFTKTTLEGR